MTTDESSGMDCIAAPGSGSRSLGMFDGKAWPGPPTTLPSCEGLRLTARKSARCPDPSVQEHLSDADSPSLGAAIAAALNAAPRE
jgi:hypothetical protein